MDKRLRLFANVIDTRLAVSQPKASIPSYSFRGSNARLPSVEVTATNMTDALVKEPVKYTGTTIIGIGQMHKSNGVPITKYSDIEDLAHMRR